MKTVRLAAVGLLVVVAITILGMNGCSHLEADGPGVSTLDKVRKTGELHVGYFLFEPTIMERSDGKLKGVFIDLIESIADSLDAKVVYHKVDLAKFAAGLQSR